MDRWFETVLFIGMVGVVLCVVISGVDALITLNSIDWTKVIGY